MAYSLNRIKYLLGEKGFTFAKIARLYDYYPEEVSMCARQVPGRVYPEIRLLISALIGKHVNEVFGAHPLTDALLNQPKKQRSAA